MFKWLRGRFGERQYQPVVGSNPVCADTESSQPGEAVSPLPSDILDYWLEVLTQGDLDGLQAADVRIPLSNAEQLARPGFDLGFGERRGQALKFIVERYEQERRKRADEQANEGMLVDDMTDPAETPLAPLPSNLPEEPRIPMALVFHVTDKSRPRVIWPEQKVGKEAPEKIPDLNIAFWFPFELNADNEICLPWEKLDR